MLDPRLTTGPYVGGVATEETSDNGVVQVEGVINDVTDGGMDTFGGV